MHKGYALIILIILWISPSRAQEYQVIEDLKLGWQHYNQSSQQLEPLLDETLVDVLYFDLSVQKYSEFSLRLLTPSDSYLYINSKLFSSVVAGEEKIIQVDSLGHWAGTDLLTFSLYAPELRLREVRTEIVSLPGSSGEHGSIKTINEARNIGRVSDQFILVTLVILILVVLLKTSNGRVFKEYFDLYHMFSPRQRFELIPSYALFSVENLSVIFLYAAFVGGSAINWVYLSGSVYDQQWYWAFDFSQFTFGLIMAGIAFTLMVLKYPLINLISILFRITKHAQVHYYSYLRLSLFYSMLVYIASLGNAVSQNSWSDQFGTIMVVLLSILLIIRLSVVSFALNSESNFQKLHIIPYLCSTELIPLVFFLKFLVK